ncbi:MAG: helix-turn-helix transcriptional regulator [Leptothrix sp. (in: b-proteobacteria)]
MERTQRFYKIEMLIRSRGSVPFVDLMAELDVSRATLKRDLEHLRSRMDAPIVYDRESNGYRLQPKPGRTALAAESAPPRTWFSDAEVQALLSMHELIGHLDVGSTLARHLLPLQERLQGMLGASEAEARELMRRVRIASPLPRLAAGRFFELVGRALTERRRLRLHIAAGARMDQCLVSPQRLVQSEQRWCLDAWCHDQKALRRVALEQIDAAELVDARARDVSLKTVEATLDAVEASAGSVGAHFGALAHG